MFLKGLIEHVLYGGRGLVCFHFHWWDHSHSHSFLVKFLEREQDVVEGMVLLLNFLVVAAALVCGPCPDEVRHGFEDLVEPAHFSVEEV